MTRLYLQLNNPGSGDVSINQNDVAAADMAIGKFIRISYRGAERGGFFIEDLKNTDAAPGGESGREIRATGPGVLSILDDGRVWFVNQGESSRRFTAQNIGFILDTVLDEAKVRGCFSNLIWDFDTAVDSDGIAWAATHTLDLKVGDSLLDVVKNFSELGVDFRITFNPAANQYVLSAFEGGIGSDKTASVVFRIGLNAIRASHTEAGNLIKNAYLVEAQGAAFSTVSDATSISAYRRREDLYSAGTAPNSTQADVFANAELTLTKDPKPSYAIIVSDARGPIAFQDYEIGDTVGYDDGDGVVVSLRVVGMMLDFDAGRFADITVELERFVKGTEIETAQKLQRFSPGMGASGNSTSDITTDHGTLTGLTDDDHPQYLLVDGTRGLGGPWDMGNFSLTNVNIDSGEITGITDLAIADGGTGASIAADARTNLGLVAGGSGDIWVEKAGDIMTGDLILNDSVNLLLGTTSNASIQYDGSDLLIDPNAVGSGDFIIQPTTDSTTLFQILDADGGTPIWNVDSVNKRIGKGTATPEQDLHMESSTDLLILFRTTSIFADVGFRFENSGDNSDSWQIYRHNSGNFQIRYSLAQPYGVSSTYFEIDTSGNIGVGGLASGKFHIIGSADDKQFIVQANSTQIANLVNFQDSLANLLIAIDGSGNLQIRSQLELRFYDNEKYVGFEAPTLTGDQIWVLPVADGNDGDVMFTDGAGNLKWGANASTRAFTFSSPSGGSGTIYAGGHYRFGASDNDFNPSITFGAANGAYGDHIFIVAAAGGSGGTDTVIRVTGTSIDDSGNSTASDTEDLTADDTGSAGAYYETSKKWIGQVTIEKQSGPDLLCNYGGAKYWDDNNEDFKVEGVEVTWLGGANDANPNLLLRHHKATGWTYNNGSTPTPPTAIADMNTDYITEIEVINGEEGAWKRTDLSTNVSGSGSEGIILEIITTANKAFETGNFLIRIVPQ